MSCDLSLYHVSGLSCKKSQYAVVPDGMLSFVSKSNLVSTGPDLIVSFCLEQSITYKGASFELVKCNCRGQGFAIITILETIKHFIK